AGSANPEKGSENGDGTPQSKSPVPVLGPLFRFSNKADGNMASKVILIADPGIDGAFAVALALHDPDLEVLGLAATAGNVTAEQATNNVHILIEQIDPRRWPRLGAALPVEYDIDGSRLHGPGGLGGVVFPCAQLHHPHSSDKVVIDLVRQFPKEVSI